MLSRRQFLYAAGASAAAGTGFYTWRIEPHWLEIVRRQLPIRGLPDALAGRTLVQLSDIHVGPARRRRLRVECVRRVAALRAGHRRVHRRLRQLSRRDLRADGSGSTVTFRAAGWRRSACSAITTTVPAGRTPRSPTRGRHRSARGIVMLAQRDARRRRPADRRPRRSLGASVRAGGARSRPRRSAAGPRAQPQPRHGRSSGLGAASKAGFSRATRMAGSASRRFSRRRCCRFAIAATRRASSRLSGNRRCTSTAASDTCSRADQRQPGGDGVRAAAGEERSAGPM